MDYKKKYEKAFAHAREIHRNEIEKRRDMEFIFPELAESEDEKIRRELIDYINRLTASPNYIDKYNTWIAWLEKQGEKKSQRMISAEAKEAMYDKPAWSEEDERRYRGLHNLIYSTQYCDSRKEFSDFLNSLKDRVQIKPQQEWSEEDEMIALSIEQVMNCTSLLNIVPEKIDKIRTWLKSLKERI